MTTHSSRLPIAIDPLIAEAKHRERRRRSFVALALVAAAVAATALTFGLRPGQAPSGSGSHVGVGATVPASPATQDAILAVLRAKFIGQNLGSLGRVARLHTLVRVASNNPNLARAIVEPLDSRGRQVNDAAWVVLTHRAGQWAIVGVGTALDCSRPTEPALRQMVCSGNPYRGFKPVR